MSSNIAIVVLVLCSILVAGSRVSAENLKAETNLKAQTRYVTIPILYVTDRNATKKGYGPQRKLEQLNSINNLHFGWLDYSLRRHETTTSSLEKQLGWSESHKRPRCVLETKELAEVKGYHDFGQVIIDAAKKSGTDDVFILVHGFNTPFDHAAKEAALLAYQVQRPLILYSWPSKGKLSQYNVDAGNNEWSQEHFDALMDELKRIKDSSGIKFTLVAHSMGNRLAVRSAPALQGKHIFKQVFLVDPDFDAETFVHYLYRYARKSAESAEVAEKTETIEPTKVRILFSHKDRALPLSEFLFGGYTRLGQAADSLLSVVAAPYAIPGKVTDALGSTANKDATITNSDQKQNWVMNFEWIDFTVLDHGVIGHTVPFEMIASLWSTSLPGEGLKLVPSNNGAPNRLASLFLHLFGEQDHISDKIDSSERVVITTKRRRASVAH
jgi:esterase/lipase superfamily enzyme